MAEEYHVESSRKVCTECGKAFAVGEQYVSGLQEIEPDQGHPHGLARLDFCPEHVPAERGGWVGQWRTQVPPAEEPKKKRIAIDDDRMLDVFFKLHEATEPMQLDLRYVIGLMLARRRRLKLEGKRRRAGQEFILVRKSRSRELHEMLDRKLSDADILNVSREIGTLLDLAEKDALEEASNEA